MVYDMDYTVTVILKSATVDIYLDKLYAKHRIMNIHEGKMVNMIHLIQLGIIHRDNVYNRAEPSCQLVKRGKKKEKQLAMYEHIRAADLSIIRMYS